MKNYFLPIVMASLLLAGCSAAYKTGQTPDDVYYSTNQNAVATETNKETPRTAQQNTNNGSYQSYFQDEDDAYLRMKVRNGGANGLLSCPFKFVVKSRIFKLIKI